MGGREDSKSAREGENGTNSMKGLCVIARGLPKSERLDTLDCECIEKEKDVAYGIKRKPEVGKKDDV